MDILHVIQIILGSAFFLFVPGFAITIALFPGKGIDALERITLSLAFSISVVPLVILFLNQLLGVETFPIDALHSLIASMAIIVLSLSVGVIRIKLKK
jgi:uncharacterized membrane protein